jgi:hypothetical protein
VCSRPECQRQRRSDYHRNKLATGPEYHQVALESGKQWRDEHPDYRKQRRRQYLLGLQLRTIEIMENAEPGEATGEAGKPRTERRGE